MRNLFLLFTIRELKIECPEPLFFYIKSEKYNTFWKSFCKIILALSHQKRCNPYHVKQHRHIAICGRTALTGSRHRPRRGVREVVPADRTAGFDGTNLRLRVPNESYVHQIERTTSRSCVRSSRSSTDSEPGCTMPCRVRHPPAVPVTADADTTAISRSNTQTNTANIKNPFVIPGLKKIIIDPQLNPGLTFATFIGAECNRLIDSYDNAGGKTWSLMAEHIVELLTTSAITVAEYAEATGPK